MRKVFLAFLFVLLTGCAPIMISKGKTPGYFSNINELAIIIDDVGVNIEIYDPARIFNSGINKKVKDFMANLKRTSADILPGILLSNTIKSNFIGVDIIDSKVDANKYSHILRLYIQPEQPTCYYSNCQISYRIFASLIDTTINKRVWNATYSILEPNSFQSLTDDAAKSLFTSVAQELKAIHRPK